MAVLVSFTLAAVALFRRKNESAVGVGGGLALLICAAPLYFVLRSPSHAFCAEGVSVVTTLTLCLTLVGGVLFLWGLVSLLEIPRRRFGGAPSAAEGKADLLKLDFYSLMWVAVAFLSVLSFVGRIVIGRCFKFGCG